MKRKFNNKISSSVRDNWVYYKGEIKNAFNDLKHKDTFYKQIPNLLTLTRVIGMIPVSILFMTGNILVGMIILGMLLSTDLFDGKIARKYGITSKLGADLDAICDKLMAFFLMIPLCLDNMVIIFNILFESLISFSNVRGRIKGVDTKTIFTGKVKTCFLSATLFMGYLSKFIVSYYNIYVLLSLLTVLAQIKTYHDYLKMISIKGNSVGINRNEVIKEDYVRKEDKVSELKREREFLKSFKETLNKE